MMTPSKSGSGNAQASQCGVSILDADFVDENKRTMLLLIHLLKGV
jgi:hypothetical protein